VCTLGINSDVRSVLDWRCLFFPSFLFSLFSSPKPFPFLAAHKTCLRKTMIPDSFTVGSSWNLSAMFVTQFRAFSNSHRWELQKHVRAKRNTLRTVVFSFLAETQNSLSKTIIPVSLTVGFSWNLDMLFEIQLRTLSPLGFAI